MLLVYDEIRADTDQSPESTMDPASGTVVERQPLELFAGAAALPDIHSIFEARSLAYLSTHGIERWVGGGGQLEHDGRLGFSAVSGLGCEILGELLAANRGFQWTDETGGSWLVLPNHEGASESSRTAIAASWYGQAWILDPLARRRATNLIESRIAAGRIPGRQWSSDERAKYAGVVHVSRRLRLVGVAAELLTAWADRHGELEFSPSDAEWMLASNAMDCLAPTADNVWAAICTASELHVAELRLGLLGWDLRKIRQAAVVTDLVRTSSDRFRLQISPLWKHLVATIANMAPSTTSA